MSGNGSSTAMAISVRSCLNRERRLVSLKSSIPDTTCLELKHNSDLKGPLTGVLDEEVCPLQRRKHSACALLHANCGEVGFHALMQYSGCILRCISTQFTCVGFSSRIVKLCNCVLWFHKPSVDPLRRIKSHIVHLGEYLSSC